MTTNWTAVEREIEEGRRIKALTGNTDHYPIRFVVTHLDRDGNRAMFGARQGRNTYATREEAQASCDAVKANNSADILSMFPSLEVRPCKCYPGHFDPCEFLFDFDMDEWLKDQSV